MASVQVLPNSSRKVGHLEAGKKRLEEFRKKKKAEGRAKKVVSTGHSQSADADQHGSSSQNYDHRDNTRGTGSSEMAMDHEEKTVYSSENTDNGSSGNIHATSSLVNHDRPLHDNTVPGSSNGKASELYESQVFFEPVNGYDGCWRVNSDELHASDSVSTSQIIDGDINHSSSHIGSQSAESRKSSKIHIIDHESGDALIQNRLGFPSTSSNIYETNGDTASGVEQYNPDSMNHEKYFGGRKIIGSTTQTINVDTAPWHMSEPSFFNQHPFPLNVSGTTSGRSLPFFVDSLGFPKVSSTPHTSYNDPPKANPPISITSAKFQSMEALSSSSTKKLLPEVNSMETLSSSMNPSISSNDSQPSKLYVSEDLHQNQDLQTQKKGEDFAALEQYIEDLMQEKFSLQRALETSRSLVETLAAENSSLTESYNQQGQVINQLKSDIERLQQEVKVQLLAIESVKLEYRNAQLECNAADERVKILATEVISLEDKALRLRSNELKLEKELENMDSEITSYKFKVTILEKERQDFQSMISVMLEEKKLLKSKLRKTSSIGNISDSTKSSSIRRDASTSSEDLGGQSDLGDSEATSAKTILQNALHDISPPMVLSSGSYRFPLLPDASSIIPSDQLKIIDNINSLISELALEKEKLMEALSTQSDNSSKLKDLNKELSQKLEVQTQRLELLTAQRMANESAPTRSVEIHSVHDTPVYADEGDEVVERVLSWIMKLFPGGGPSKRRSSKLV